MKTQHHRRPRLSALVLCLGLIAALAFPAAMAARALSEPNQAPEDYLTQTLAALGVTPDSDYLRKDTYSHNLVPNGYEYTFTVNGEPSYALMVYFTADNGDLYHDVTEMFFNSPAPFAQAKGLPVYIDKFTYFDYADETFTDLETQKQIPYEVLSEIAENATVYGANSDGGTATSEKIYYSRRTSDSYEFPYGLPGYYASSHVNTCGAIAGGNVLGYYDIFFPNLIPDCETTYVSDGVKKYHLDQPKKVTEIIDNDLYTHMQVAQNNGTTFDNFENGLKTYVESRGNKVEYYEVAPNKKLDTDMFRMEIYLAHPVAVFMAGYNVTDGPFILEGYDNLSIAYYKTAHVMAASGYYDVEYYNKENVMFRKDSYMCVNAGDSWTRRGYMRLNDNETFDHAIGIEIY